MQIHPGGRSPHGERGLKSPGLHLRGPGQLSLPSRGAWIEIDWSQRPRSQPASLPSRGAWIEITEGLRNVQQVVLVAPLTGSVD